MQPETRVQHMVNVIDHGMNLQMTTDAARFTHNQASTLLSLETRLFSRLVVTQGRGDQLTIPACSRT